MPIVVLAPATIEGGITPRASACVMRRGVRPSGWRLPATTRAVLGSITSPAAFTATNAAMRTPSTARLAVPMPPFIACAMPNILPTVAPAPAPTLPCAGALRRCGFTGGESGLRIGPHARIAEPEVEQHRGRHDRNSRRADRKTVAMLVEPTHHAAGGIEPERAAAGQQQRVHLVDEVARHQQIGLARAGCRAAHIDTAGDAGFAQHHRAAGGPARVGVVADLQPCDVGDRTGERCHGDKPTAWSSTTSARRDRRHRRATRKQRAGG